MLKESFKKIKKFFKENTISALTAVFLGIATLLVAWAGWIGALLNRFCILGAILAVAT